MKHRSASAGRKKALSPLTLTATLTAALIIGGVGFSAHASELVAPHNTAVTAPETSVSSVSATLWGKKAPTGAAVDSDRVSVELGTKFTAQSNGAVSGIRFWKNAENTGTHVGNLWDSSGILLASATFTNETASGWQTAALSKPVSLTAGKKYTVSYMAPNGRYVSSQNHNFQSDTPSLAVGTKNSGVYTYGSKSAFPRNSWQSSNYWVDVQFTASNDSARPPVTPTTPPVKPTVPPVKPTTPPVKPTVPPVKPTTPPVKPTTPPVAPPVTEVPPVTPPVTPPVKPASNGEFAGENNTGPSAAGFNPTQKYTGPLTITKAGTVITNQIIPAGLRIEADDVTIQGNIIEGPTDVSWDQAALHITGKRAHVLDNTIRGLSATDWRQTPINGIKLVGEFVDFQRNNVYRISGDAISIYGDNATLVGNWVHDFVFRDGGVHYDGLHYPGQAGDDTTEPALIKDNTVEMWVSGGSSGMTGAMTFPDVASRIVVDHNLVAGGNYAIMGGGSGITFTNNMFWTKFSPKVGYYGLTAYIGTIPGVTWTNNSITNDGKTVSSVLKSY